MAVFGSIFICAGLVVGYFAYFPALIDWWRSSEWVEEPCWIERVEMKTTRGNKGSVSYTVEADYRYEHHGRSYRSNRVSLYSGGDNIGGFQHSAYDELRRYAGHNKPFRCLVNPEEPQEALLYRDLRWGLLLLISLFPTFFTLVGGMVAVGGMAAARQYKTILALQEQNPDAPWKWKPEWAEREIHPSKDGLAAFMVISAWIIIIQLPLIAAVIISGALAESWMAVFVFIPVTLGLLPMRTAWRRLRMKRWLGDLRFIPRHWPLRPGSVMEGRLLFSRPLPPEAALEIKVRCQRKITRGSGRQSTTTEEILWEQTQSLSAMKIQQADQCWLLPVRVPLSPDFPGQDSQPILNELRSPQEIQWSMTVTGMPGMTPLTLPLPVFGEADKTFHENSLSASDSGVETVVTQTSQPPLETVLKTYGIEARFDPQGQPLSLFSPPGRNRTLAISLLVFGSLWTCIWIILMLQNAPLLFKVIWGISAPVIEWSGLRMLLHQRRVEFARDQMKITNQIGPIQQNTELLEPHLILGFKHAVYMTSNSTAYYRVQAETTFGKAITLVDSITSETAAERLKNSLQAWKERR